MSSSKLANVSIASKDHLDLFLQKAKRQADRRLREQYGKDDE